MIRRGMRLMDDSSDESNDSTSCSGLGGKKQNNGGGDAGGEPMDESEVKSNLTPKGLTTNGATAKLSPEEKKAKSTCGYCGEPRKEAFPDLMCATCLRWFHGKCSDAFDPSVFLGHMQNYTFLCRKCADSSVDVLTKKSASFAQMCMTAVANLTVEDLPPRGVGRSAFHTHKEIIPYIERHWERLTTAPRRSKTNWHITVAKTLLRDKDVFAPQIKDVFSLVDQDLMNISPSYEGISRAGSMTFAGAALGDGSVVKGLRGLRRRAEGYVEEGGMEVATSTKRARGAAGDQAPLPWHGFPLDYPINKDGFQYVLAESDPHAPYRRAWDESEHTAGRPLPGYFCRVSHADHVLLSLHDRANQLQLDGGRLRVTGQKGYSTIRGTHGVTYGTCYFEMTVESMPEGSACRVGWATNLANLQAPVGYDRHGYSWRSKKGTIFHAAQGTHYMDSLEGYKEGDTLGFLIHLPLTSVGDMLPLAHKDKPVILFKSYYYFEDKIEEKAVKGEGLEPLVDSYIHFYKNGRPYGEAFRDLYKGRYFPALSLYKECTVRVNFGPHFKHPPRDSRFTSLVEYAKDLQAQQTMADILYFVDHKRDIKKMSKMWSAAKEEQ